jgi:4a-hydroxytetrahydrobiopterin dehydratase
MWDIKENRLVKSFEFESFRKAMAFVQRVGNLAEQWQHHPDILIEYKKVTLYLCTHDAHYSITDKDHDLAEKIDQLLVL